MLKIGNYSIKQKLTWGNMLVSSSALIVAFAAFVTYEVTTLQKIMARNLSIQAQIVGSNCVSALLFGDPNSAQRTLSALQAAPHILSAGIYAPTGEPFAVYWRDRAGNALPLPTIPAGEAETYFHTGKEMALVRSIVFQGKVVGKVYIRSDLQEVNDRLWRYAGAIAAVLPVSLLVAFVLSSMIQRTTTRPIMQLAETARIVTREKKYSVRAPVTTSHDEIAVLIEAFNEMLNQIQECDAALQQAHERLNLALQSSGVGTWSWDIDDGAVSLDDYTAPLFGLEPGMFSGKYEDFLKLLQPGDRDCFRRALVDSDAISGFYDTEFRVIRPDGSLHVLSARGKIHRDEAGRPVRITGACWDITERKRAEEQIKELNQTLEHRVADRTSELEAANKELEAFTYSVAHDLRAPLRHIQGFSAVLTEDFGPRLDPAAIEYLKRIVESTQHMGCLIDDLLGFAHVGRQELCVQATGLNTLVREVLRDLKHETEGRNIEWRIADLPFVDCDRGLMKQVFYNLLSNAAKYTRPRNPAIIEAAHTSLKGQSVFSVKDNGVGFNMKYAAKLFGVFQRMHRREDFEGTGVGLATAQRIVNKHGGRIWAEAELDKGATFFFSLGPPPNELQEGGGGK
jgi:PAS domain S-box-containing protein